jgi:hypothetical protein
MDSQNLGSVDFLVDKNEKRPINEQELRKLAVLKLTNDFLAVDELSLESRTYLVKTTLPTVVIALEKLMKEMKTRNIPMDSRKQLLGKSDAIQHDKPVPVFDTINWLGNILFY